jgi:uncharacterized membrane protein
MAAMSNRRWSDEDVERAIAALLREGVRVAATFVLAGGAMYLARHGAEQPHFGVFRGEPTDLRTVRGIVGDAVSLRGRGVIQLGLLLLIATPVARVALSLVAFAMQADWTYVAVTTIVILILVASLTGLTP